MRFLVMFVTAVCVLFLIKLRWPKKKNFYFYLLLNTHKYKISSVSELIVHEFLLAAAPVGSKKESVKDRFCTNFVIDFCI